MASAGFTFEHVNSLMQLLDDNKDQISEGQYIHMCNAMSTLYKTTTRTTENKSIHDFHRVSYKIQEIQSKLATPHLFKIASIGRKKDALKKAYPTYYYDYVSRPGALFAIDDKAIVDRLENILFEHNIESKNSMKRLYKRYLDELDILERQNLRNDLQLWQQRLNLI